MNTVDWQAVFFSVQDALRARARKRFGDTPDAESAFNYALDTLSDTGFDTLGKHYAGRGSPEGYVIVRVVNLMHDYATAKYGRARPPAWLARLGSTWKQAFDMLCLRRQMPGTIVDALYAAAGIDATTAQRMLREIKARIPRCGQFGAGEMAMTDASPSGQVLDQTADAADEAPLETHETQSLLGALHGVFDSAAAIQGDDPVSAPLADALRKLGSTIDLPDDDRLLLRLVYQQGFTLAKAARALGLRDHDIRRRHTRLMQRLRSAMQDCGLAPIRGEMVA